MEEALSAHSKWLDELMTENEQFGEVFQFKADPDSPYLEQYKLDDNQIAKVGNNFVTLNSSDTIRKEGKINFKIKLEHPSEHMLMGLCNAFLRHDANIYS